MALMGQTFTTGTNTSGYVLTSLAWKSAGNGNSFPTVQLYDLYIYAFSGRRGDGQPVCQLPGLRGGGTENDWFKWVGPYTFGAQHRIWICIRP